MFVYARLSFGELSQLIYHLYKVSDLKVNVDT